MLFDLISQIKKGCSITNEMITLVKKIFYEFIIYTGTSKKKIEYREKVHFLVNYFKKWNIHIF